MMEKAHNILFLITLAGLSAFGPFVTDMYLPALPKLPQIFSTTAFWAQMSMSVCMVGLAAGQVVIGPLSDKFGRRKLLLFSMWLFVFSTFACIFSKDIYFFIAMRFFQGIAGAGGIVLARSIPSDNYSGMQLARFLALIAAVHSVAPVAAPIIGGITLTFFTWQAVFVWLFILGLVLLLMSYKIKESLEPARRSKLSTLAIFKLYKNVFCDKVALSYILQQGAMAIVLFSYIAASPFIFQDVYGLSAMAFSGIFATNALGIGLGAAFSAKFTQRRTAIIFGAFGALVAALVAAILIHFDAPVAAVEASLFTMMAMFGISAPPAAAIILDSQRANAGTAAAFLGAMSFFFGSIAVPLTGFGNTIQTFSFIILFGSASAAVLSLIARHYQKKFGPTTALQ